VTRLDKAVTKKSSGNTDSALKKRSKINVQFEMGSTSNEIDEFAISVLKKLIEEGIPPTPDNFKIYFEKLLDGKDMEFQKNIQDLLEFEENSTNENRAEIEKDIKEMFSRINGIIKVVNSIYKNIRLIKQLSSETEQELQNNNNSLTVKNVAMGFKDRLDKFISSIDKQLESLKEQYQKAGENFKSLENSTIFDTRFGVYNKRYFIEQTKQERQKIIKFRHESCIVVIQIKEDVLKKIPYQKDQIFLLRIIAKMLLKTSRRNDIVSYFGESSFMLLLRHTDIDSAQMASKRIYEMIINSNIILNDKEIQMSIGIGISRIDRETEIEDSISCALKAAEEKSSSEKPYKICQQEKG